ncbi:STAS domain-containing protein [Candidatus Uabimicrobium sp. HlEnr_7]|uniref:STAS domain-containing protein n=1 Tax=Candidatus Uabimicrobium helgolandensis TaxID=3095367 RepID=UPI0035564307
MSNLTIIQTKMVYVDGQRTSENWICYKNLLNSFETACKRSSFIIIDLTNGCYLSSAGTMLLITISEKAKRKKITLLLCAQQQHLQIFDILGILEADFFQTFKSLKQCLEFLGDKIKGKEIIEAKIELDNEQA